MCCGDPRVAGAVPKELSEVLGGERAAPDPSSAVPASLPQSLCRWLSSLGWP